MCQCYIPYRNVVHMSAFCVVLHVSVLPYRWVQMDVCCSRGGLGTHVRMLTSLGLLLIDAAGVAVAQPVAVIDTTGAWAWFWRIH